MIEPQERRDFLCDPRALCCFHRYISFSFLTRLAGGCSTSLAAPTLSCLPPTRGALAGACPGVLLEAQLPRCAQSPLQHVLISSGQPDMRHAHSSPSAGNGDEHVGLFGDKLGLLLRCQHQVTVTLLLRGERCEYPAAHTKIRRPHVRAFLGAFQAQCDPAEV